MTSVCLFLWQRQQNLSLKLYLDICFCCTLRLIRKQRQVRRHNGTLHGADKPTLCSLSVCLSVCLWSNVELGGNKSSVTERVRNVNAAVSFCSEDCYSMGLKLLLVDQSQSWSPRRQSCPWFEDISSSSWLWSWLWKWQWKVLRLGLVRENFKYTVTAVTALNEAEFS